MIKYKKGKDNVLANALSCRYTLISTLSTKMSRFEHIHEMCEKDDNVGALYPLTHINPHERFC